MDGKGVVRHFTHEYGTPVIVISAQHSASETNAATQAGALHFLHKPFATPELIERLRLVLGRGRRLSQA
jgi:DNA-binding response OmpR family regulator